MLGYLRSISLKSPSGVVLHPIEALIRQEQRDESAYLFDREGRWFKFELGEGRGEIDFHNEFGICDLHVEFGSPTPRLSLSIFGVGLVCIEEGIEALRVYPIQHWSGIAGDRRF